MQDSSEKSKINLQGTTSRQLSNSMEKSLQESDVERLDRGMKRVMSQQTEKMLIAQKGKMIANDLS